MMKKLLPFFPIFLCSLLSGKVKAQICNATNSLGCNKATKGDIRYIGFKHSYKSDYFLVSPTCSGSPAQNTVVNAGKPVNIYANEKINIRMSGTDSAGIIYTKVGIWLDMNFNDSFEASECLSDPQTGKFNTLKLSETLAMIQMPCFTNSGACKMRFRGFSSKMTPTIDMGCGTVNTSGTIYDVEVYLHKAAQPVADFTFPKKEFAELFCPIVAKNGNYYYDYIWKVDSPSFRLDEDFAVVCKWKNGGSFQIKLITEYCGMSDSMIDTIHITMPTAPPDFDIILSDEQIEIYYDLQAFPDNTDGVYQWQWELTSPTGNVYTSSQQNPFFNIDETGKWKFCGRLKNAVGWSNWVCKTLYGIAPLEHYMGTNHLGYWDSGMLFDNGGTLNYGNNRKPEVDYFQIRTTVPHIALTIQKLELADTNDRLKIYVGEGDTGKAIHPIGGFRAGNLPQTPTTFFVHDTAIYITFESDSSKTDKGWVITWRAFDKTSVYGLVYVDKDSNCIYHDSVDRLVDHIPVYIGNGSMSTVTKNGLYHILSDTTDKVVEPRLPKGWLFQCPISGKDTWSLNKFGQPIHFALKPDLKNPLLDIGTVLIPPSGFVVSRGLDRSLELKVQNTGNLDADTVSCVLRASRKLDYLKLKNGAYTGNDSVLYFTQTQFEYFDFVQKDVLFKVKAGDTGSLNFQCDCHATGSTKDADSGNNMNLLQLRIVNAHDPNDKQASVAGPFMARNETLKYLVRFQNTGTAPAETVVVTDTLSALLDTASIQLIETSHKCVLEKNGNHLAFRFDNINLQDSTHNEPMSHGYLYYSVRPKSDILPYQKIKNTAYIYFDAEAPIVTNTTENYWALKPQLELIGKQMDTIDLCSGSYTDLGATCTDSIDGNISSFIQKKGSIRYGNRNADTLWYSVTTSYNYTASIFRIIYKMDLLKPHIVFNNKNIVDKMIIPIQVGSLFVDKVMADNNCLGTFKPKATAGFNGPVNTLIRAVYPITYYATDPDSNKAYEDGYTVHYKVDDFVAPVIHLNTPDTVYHPINTPYVSVAVSVTDNYFEVKDISITKFGNVNAYALGLYTETFVAIDPAGNSDTAVRYVKVVEDVSGNTRFTLKQNVLIWPNPASEALHISNVSKTCTAISIYDLQGRHVRNIEITEQKDTYTVNITGLGEGFFVLRICDISDCTERPFVIVR